MSDYCEKCGGDWELHDFGVPAPSCPCAMRIIEALTQQLSAAQDQIAELEEAAEAVVARWDTPTWKDAEHTSVFINRLRSALSAYNGQK